MLSPSEVPVADSGTFLVIVLLAIVLSRAPDITMGIITIHSSVRLLTKDWGGQEEVMVGGRGHGEWLRTREK